MLVRSIDRHLPVLLLMLAVSCASVALAEDTPEPTEGDPLLSVAEDNRHERNRGDAALPGFERVTIKPPTVAVVQPTPVRNTTGQALPYRFERRYLARPPLHRSVRRFEWIRRAAFTADRG